MWWKTLSGWQKWLALSLIVLSFSGLLREGFFGMHDDMQAMRVLQMKKCILDWQIPCRWVPDMGYGYGYPQFNFYPPLPYYFMVLIHFLGLSIIDSVKVGFIATFILSAWGMYLLARTLWSEWGGVLSSLMYVFLPYRAVNVYNRGAMGEIWAMAFFPFIWWGMERFIQTRRYSYGLIFSLSIAGLLTSHLLSSMMFFPALAVWGVWRLWQERLKDLGTLILQLTGFGLLGFGLASFYLIPVMGEKSSAHFETLVGGYFGFQQHFVSLRQLFATSAWAYGSSVYGPYDEMAFHVGYLHWLLPIVSLAIGVWMWRKKESVLKVGLLIGLALGLIFMTHVRSSFIWNVFPPLEWLQFPWRFLAPAGFMLSLAAGSIGIWRSELKWNHLWLILIPLLLLNVPTMRPRDWVVINDEQKFSGELWTKQQTISIFDYLPIAAEAPPTEPAPEQPWWIEGSGNVLTFEKGTDWQIATVEGLESGILRLPLFDFPGWIVKVDNQVVPIDHSNHLGLITFQLPAGQHTVEAELMDTPMRLIGNSLTVLSILLCMWVGMRNTLLVKKLYENK